MKKGRGTCFRSSSKFNTFFPAHLVVKYLHGLGRATIFNNTERSFLSGSGEEIGTLLGQWTLAGAIRQASQPASQTGLGFSAHRNLLLLFLESNA